MYLKHYKSQIWRKKNKELTEAIKGNKKFDATDKIWETRNKISDKFSDKQFVGVKNPETGELTKTRNETMDVMLEYNYGLLKKDVRIGDRLLRGDCDDRGFLIKEPLEERDEENEWDADDEKDALEIAKSMALKIALEEETFPEDLELKLSERLHHNPSFSFL